MTNIHDLYPSNYLKASDLNGREWDMTMDRVEMADMGNEKKPVLFFDRAEKGLVLNKTNANTIAAIFGPETNGWAGQLITLYPTTADFRGQQVPAIRVKMAQQMQQALQTSQAPLQQGNGLPNPSETVTRPVGGMGEVAAQQSEAPAPNFSQELSDEIPF